MFPNAKMSEDIALLGVVSPISQGAGTATSAWVAAANVHTFLATILTGVMGASATVDAKIQQATDSSGTSAKDVTGKSITQLVKASNDNNQSTISFRADDLDVANSFNYVRLSITVGTAASLIAGALHGVPRFKTATSYNAASVVENV